MTDDDREALRTWAAAHAPAGSLQARQVLALLCERDALADALLVQIDLNRALADRVAAQSELLSRRAEPRALPSVQS